MYHSRGKRAASGEQRAETKQKKDIRKNAAGKREQSAYR
jgi:hypothetical protein